MKFIMQCRSFQKQSVGVMRTWDSAHKMLLSLLMMMIMVLVSLILHFEYGADAKLASNWIMGDIAAYLKNEKLSVDEIKITPLELSELIASINNETISGKFGKEVLVELIAKGGTVKSVIEEKDLVQIADPAAIEAMVDQALTDIRSNSSSIGPEKQSCRVLLLARFVNFECGAVLLASI